MENVRLTQPETKSLAYDGIRAGIISKKRIPEFHGLLFDEGHDYDPNNLLGFHGACTQLYRDIRMGNQYTVLQRKLHKFVDDRFNNYLYRIPSMN